MDGRRYDSKDGGGRIVPGATIENNAGAIVESTQDDSMDGIGRVASGTKTEQLPNLFTVNQHFELVFQQKAPTLTFMTGKRICPAS